MGLSGKRILVTRGEEQAGALCAAIRARGGVPVRFPTVRLVAPDDPGPVDRAVASLSSYDWLLFASANAVRFFALRVRLPKDLPPRLRVAAVGPGTAREARERGFPVHLVARTHTAEGLAAALEPHGVSGKRFLLPRAREGREVLPGLLARRGGSVDAVEAYRNGLPERDEEGAARIAADPPDVCTFASPSAFRNFLVLLGEDRAGRVLSRTRIAVIGEVTAKAVRERNFPVDIMPETYTLERMLDAIEERLRGGATAPAGPTGGKAG